ncbi:hypothetical protein PJ311_18525 [Bacillus sp. CLL-7-23]|uniref:Uncharacterized protein n=1 Tax=Bacillus changyiensis TaxID=3004103 RepID=A0ABT4XAW8_9BACI|nr:hypothetical protein [Bacillus changyiensis]MDA7028537.1 hypothetical protein [Bacillus changyiensis]
MYKRIVVAVAGALFALLALLAAIITDLYDRDYPQAIGVENRVSLNFSESGFSITEAFEKLEELDARWDLGLVKVAPDLANDGDGQIFVALNDGDLPAKFTWFGGEGVGKIVGKERLTTSYPDGFYLVTGKSTHLSEFEDTLKSAGVKVDRGEASIFNSLEFVVRERGFTAAILAAFALIATLALFWLSLKARGRALRVLGGCPTVRIQMQDLAGFGGALLFSAGVIALAAAGYVGLFHGWVYVGTFLKVLVSLQVAVIAVSLLAALIMSASAWPSATMLATRQPAIKSLRSAAIVIQALTFLLVVAAAGPAWSAYKHSSAMAAEMAQWKKLSDQVAIVFATDVNEMDHMEPRIGKLVKDAESLDKVALSYTYTKEMQMPVDFGEYSAISFVNQRWLDLVTTGAPRKAVTSVPNHSISDGLVKMIREEAELLSRKKLSDDRFAKFKFLRPVDGFQLPVAQGGGGERLLFADDALVVVVPSLYDTYNDSTLTSMVSGSNIMFTGVTPTQQLLKKHGLDVKALRDRGIKGELNVVYVAEDGILQAQFAAYIVWLLNLALIALVIAFTVAAAISAMITAMLQAKRDFPLRVAGQSWVQILQSRVTKELLAGVGLVGVVVLLQRPDEIWAVVVAAVYGLLVVPLSHLFAARWCFNSVSRRRI